MEQRIEPMRNLFALAPDDDPRAARRCPVSPAFAWLHGLVGAPAHHAGFGDAGDLARKQIGLRKHSQYVPDGHEETRAQERLLAQASRRLIARASVSSSSRCSG